MTSNIEAPLRRAEREPERTVVPPVVVVENLSKTYASGFHALKNIDLEIRRGEIFALLGPNGAGKTTLISIICGLVNASEGRVLADGFDIVSDYREARSRIGLVPQELTNEAFETVWATVSFSRGLFGKPPDPEHIERVLKSLTLWDKRNNKLITLSGGMKRRVLIAKALSHEPKILFLDEPTAGVDVELRREMWEVVRRLRDSGVTIILTTHYIEEAEEMADRIGVINHGEIILVEEKRELMRKLGSKQLTLHLRHPLETVPERLAGYRLELAAGGKELIYHYDANLVGDHDEGGDEASGIAALLSDLDAAGIRFKDLHTKQSSLEEIFVSLVRERR
ncbi:ABC transporter ATP-binding protein [Litchfieldella qijiaojingensis]|uniref:ABC transporter ATP-binding protein n=1 Tax=Litchfieldella qijiaojingensis TaxID=980347 RepID=A0ABQ2Y9J9_9GAMM|nr:ABC transporter ATP-binding protein [Halomonas qijiaojingensis]GGX77162.1 ABC transporter ATP-binding protein [Halomonas qijiaojingensis]